MVDLSKIYTDYYYNLYSTNFTFYYAFDEEDEKYFKILKEINEKIKSSDKKTIIFEEYINLILSTFDKNLSFNDLILEIDLTQELPKDYLNIASIFLSKYSKNKKIYLIKKLLTQFYFPYVEKEDWLLKLFDFNKNFNNKKFNKISSLLWFKISDTWEDIVKHTENKKIIPLIPIVKIKKIKNIKY